MFAPFWSKAALATHSAQLHRTWTRLARAKGHAKKFGISDGVGGRLCETCARGNVFCFRVPHLGLTTIRYGCICSAQNSESIARSCYRDERGPVVGLLSASGCSLLHVSGLQAMCSSCV